MLYLNNIFSNAEEFKQKFGTPAKRQNKLTLATLMLPLWRNEVKDYIKEGLCEMIKVWTPSQVYRRVISHLNGFPYELDNDKVYQQLCLNGNSFYHSEMHTDEYNGLCIDGDTHSIRYVKDVETQNGTEEKVYKMKAAKMLRQIAIDTERDKQLTEAVLNYVCEEFQREWEAYAERQQARDDYELVVDDDFEAIYSECNYADGNFHSCMTDEEQHSFYEESVKAQAASLRNKRGEIIARCIVFTDVTDEDGEKYRLGERQYSADSNVLYMRMLVDKLIEEKIIDGYKKISAGCGDATAFVSNDGEDWSDKHFKIDCSLDYGDTLSYQDSFKYYNIGRGIAYNHSCDAGRNYDELDTTDPRFGESAYDDYHDYSCRETTTVYRNGQEYQCDSDNLDDFYYVEDKDGYYHEEDVCCIDGTYFLTEDYYQCDRCGDWVHEDDAYWSDITEEYYCCEDCMSRAEDKYKEENWNYSELTDEYYEYMSELEEAEQEYKEENWYHSEILDEYFEDEDEMNEAEEEYIEKHPFYSEYMGEYYATEHEREVMERRYAAKLGHHYSEIMSKVYETIAQKDAAEYGAYAAAYEYAQI